MKLGERIRLVRQRLQQVNRRRYSLESVARRTGVVSRQGLSQIELGKVKNPTAKVLGRIAADLGVSLEFLLAGAKEGGETRGERPRGLKREWEALRGRVAEFLEGRDVAAEEGLEIAGLRRVKRLAEGGFDEFVKALADFRAVPPGRPSVTAARLENEVAALGRGLAGSEGKVSFEVWSRVGSLADCLEAALSPAPQGEGGSFLRQVRRLSRCLERRELSVVLGGGPARPASWRVDLADLRLTVEYRGAERLPAQWVDEFKERLRFEWEMLLRRARRDRSGAEGSGPGPGKSAAG